MYEQEQVWNCDELLADDVELTDIALVVDEIDVDSLDLWLDEYDMPATVVGCRKTISTVGVRLLIIFWGPVQLKSGLSGSGV